MLIDRDDERELDELNEAEETEDEELPEDEETDEPEDETSEEDESEQSEAEGDEESEDDEELVVTIGDEKPEEDDIPAGAPKWVKDTRRENRELKKRVRELERGQPGAGAAERKQLGPKPKLADSNYDEDKHEAALDAWYAAKREADEAERQAKAAADAQQREWDSRVQAHEKSKGALKVKGYNEAEETVFEALDETQRGIIIGGAQNSALVVYALAKNPKALKELAAIKDPVRYTFAVAKLETKLKTTKRRPASAPEGTISGGNAGAARKGSLALDKAREKAERTGDYTEVNRLRREARERAKQRK